MNATHVRPDGRPARDAAGRLVTFPALCGAPTFGINNIERSFAPMFTGDLCHDCGVAAGVFGQLTLVEVGQ